MHPTGSGPGDAAPIRLRGDEPELYAAFNQRLLVIVSRSVRASREDVDDGCAHAWMEFLRHQPDRDGAWKSWLVTTATRQVWKLTAQRTNTSPFARLEESFPGSVPEPADPRDRTELAMEFQAAMEELRRLPDRLRAVVFMRS